MRRAGVRLDVTGGGLPDENDSRVARVGPGRRLPDGTGARRAPDDLERSVALMAKIGSASSPSFSPDGRTLAFVTNLGGLPQVWTVDAAGGYPQLVTAFDDPVGFVEWSPAGEWLAFTLAPGGGMNEQVYLVRPDGTGLKRLTDGGKETNRLGPWADDGATLAIGSNKRDGAAIDAYVYDVAAGTSRLAAENRGIGGFDDLSRDGKWGLLNRLVNRGDNNLYLVELASGRETLLTPHEGPGSFSGEFARDGRAVYLETNADRDQIAFARMELSTDDAERNRQARQGHVAGAASGRGGRKLRARRRRDDGRDPLERGGPERARADGSEDGQDRRRARSCRRRSPAGWTSRRTASRSPWSSPARRPRRTSGSWTFRRARSARSRRARTPGVDLAKLVRPELLDFRAHDGLPLSGWLYRPESRPGAVSDRAVVSRRSRRPGAPGLQQPLPGAALARHRRLRAQRPRLLRLRKAIREPRQRRPARRRRQGHQGLRRRGRPSGRGRARADRDHGRAPTAATWSWPA